MKVYDLVKQILTDYPATRDSDKRLIWQVWAELDLLSYDWRINKVHFLEAPACESITRARRAIQKWDRERAEKFGGLPKLQPSKVINKLRREKESKQGTFVFHEQV